MGYYDVSGAEPLLDTWTPGDALDDMRSLDNGIRGLGEAVTASAVSDKFKAEYALFMTEWRAFYEDHSSGIASWFSRGRYAFKKRLENYQDLLNKWREAFVREGGSLANVPTHNMPASKGFPWGWALGIAGVGYLVYRVFQPANENIVTFRTKGER